MTILANANVYIVINLRKQFKNEKITNILGSKKPN